MDPRAQDVLLCDLCETDPLQYCCEHCDINLCTDCVSKHLSDSSKKHKIVPYHLHRKFTPKYSTCLKHADKDCEMYCESCHIPVCITCISSGKHKAHDLSDILEKLSSKKQRIQKDLEELENKIYPRYTEISSAVQTEKAEVETNYGKLATTADQQGKVWHREVTAIVNKRKADIVETKTKHLSLLDKQADEITHRMTEINQAILEMKNILDTNDISLTSTYKSRNDEFNKLPPKIKVTLPSLSLPTINTETLNEMFGLLTSLSVTTVKTLLDEPRLTATIDTEYIQLSSVSCLSEDQVWTCSLNNKTMKLLNLQSKLLTSIQTKSENEPRDIAVTRDGYLVYTDTRDGTVNLIKNKQIQTVITLQGWIPLSVCCTAANNLLVTMVSDDRNQSKVVRYSGSTQKQSIQFDDQGRPLYSSGGYYKYISENRNLDICVADRSASAVVVVNQSGKLRFRYTGHPSNTWQSFTPVGITTDSQSHILTADCDNHRIHILDQDGQFLRYIHCDLRRPLGLCVDIRDNLFVAECRTAEVKKIEYL
ncbi:E3 ubiquitin-protein ligase TRIM71-like [Ostrea edulis]|uniref:E3 ubiquitin-protein ligase TRIM71-like n=1 Tax=Ostrea edulis TaxID=37623 RepID=UPI0024AF8C28|nr:E3 ubiquitin-protein ligase TRIM71-like [Ostrea edulis]XP_056007717.1 E3 ubiquitin-protein ligase TRIM71-like [Ostrea edulis]